MDRRRAGTFRNRKKRKEKSESSEYDRIENAPLPLLLKTPDTIAKMIEPRTHYLRSVVEQKWSLVERAVGYIGPGIEKYLGQTDPRRRREHQLGDEIRRLTRMVKRQEGTKLRTLVENMAERIEKARRKRNTLTHGELITAPTILPELKVEVGRNKETELSPAIQGPLKMILRRNNTEVEVNSKELKKMNTEVEGVLKCLYAVYKELGMTGVTLSTKVRIEGDESIHFGGGQQEVTEITTVDIEDVYKTEPREAYECMMCGKVGSYQFARECHGMIPTPVETEDCMICNKTYAKDKRCEHLAEAEKYMKGSETEQMWTPIRMILTAEQAREMANGILETVERIEGENGIVTFNIDKKPGEIPVPIEHGYGRSERGQRVVYKKVASVVQDGIIREEESVEDHIRGTTGEEES